MPDSRRNSKRTCQRINPVWRRPAAWSNNSLWADDHPQAGNPLNAPRRLAEQAGFTLIEMAIVIVIVGIIISIVSTILPTLISSSKIKQAQATLEKVDYAIQGYLAANGRSPCPDTDNDGFENRIPGASPPTDDTCTAYIGSLPHASLGLSSATDPWQEPIRFGVYEDMIRTQVGGICSAMPCTLCLSDFSTHPNAAFLRTTAGGTSVNQAYIIVSGGPKDMDGTGGFFDGLNGDGIPLEFEAPNRITSAVYDDLTRAASFTYLQGKLCSGALGGGGGGGGAGEGPAAGNCNDGVDNDGDTLIDCADPGCATDPFCAGGSAVTISTPTLPGGVLSSAYMTTVGATGGTTPYEWSLVSNGGFSGLVINQFTGSISGPLDQCPGTYCHRRPGPGCHADRFRRTENRSEDFFDLLVTSSLNITCTSTPGTTLTWSSAMQEETFTADGGRLGTIAWSLNSGGAAGFSVVSTGVNTCVMRKTGSTAPGTYSFTLRASDSSCASNAVDLVLNVTVTSSGGGAPGGIGGIVDSYVFDNSAGYDPDIYAVGGDIYAVAYTGPNSDGFLSTLRIAADGQITNSSIAQLEFDPQQATDPDLIHVTDDIYAISYTDRNSRGHLVTVRIGADGQLSHGILDELIFDSNYCYEPDSIQISSNMIAIAYTGPGNDGFIKTVQIESDGRLTAGVIDTLEFNASNGLDADITHVDGDVYAIAYRGSGNDGFVATVAINSSGQIGDSILDTLEFDTANGTNPDIIRAGSDIFAIAYTGSGNDGFIRTVAISAAGQIGNAVLDSLEFDPNSGLEPVMANISGGIMGIAYRGTNDDGYFCTVQIDESGNMGTTPMDILEFDAANGMEPSIVPVAANVFAIAYRGQSNRGTVNKPRYESCE